MELIKASLLSAVMQSSGSIQSGICDEIKAMPVCGSVSIGDVYKLYLKSGLLSEQAESVQQMTYTNEQSLIFYPRVIVHPKYFYLCVYPSNANPNVDDFYEAISCGTFSNNQDFATTLWNYTKSDYSGYYMEAKKYPTGYGASITAAPDAQRLSIYVSIALSGAYTRKTYDETGQETGQTGGLISSSHSLDIGRAITGTGYETYTKLSQNQYENYLRGIAQYAYSH